MEIIEQKIPSQSSLNPDYVWAESYYSAFLYFTKRKSLISFAGGSAFLTLAYLALDSYYTKPTLPIAISFNVGIACVFIYHLISFIKKRKDLHFEDALKQARIASAMSIGELLLATKRMKYLKWLTIGGVIFTISCPLGAAISGGLLRGIPFYNLIGSTLFSTLVFSSYIFIAYFVAVSYLIKKSVSLSTYELLRRVPEVTPEAKAAEKTTDLSLFMKILFGLSLIITVLVFIVMIRDPNQYSDKLLPLGISYPKTWNIEEVLKTNGTRIIYLSPSKLDTNQMYWPSKSVGWIGISIESPDNEVNDKLKIIRVPKRPLQLKGAMEVQIVEPLNNTDGSYQYWVIYKGKLFKILVHMPIDQTESVKFELTADKIVSSLKFRD